MYFQLYPLWLCPFILPNEPGMVHPRAASGDDAVMYVDIGAYGTPLVSNYHPRATTRKVEQFVSKCKGFVFATHIYSCVYVRLSFVKLNSLECFNPISEL